MCWQSLALRIGCESKHAVNAISGHIVEKQRSSCFCVSLQQVNDKIGEGHIVSACAFFVMLARCAFALGRFDPFALLFTLHARVCKPDPHLNDYMLRTTYLYAATRKRQQLQVQKQSRSSRPLNQEVVVSMSSKQRPRNCWILSQSLYTQTARCLSASSSPTLRML